MHHVTEASAHSAPEHGNGAAKWAPVHRSKGVEGSGAGSVSRGSEDQQPAHPLAQLLASRRRLLGARRAADLVAVLPTASR